MTEPIVTLTISDQEALRDIIVTEYRTWLVNSLPAPYTQVSKADAIKIIWLVAQKIENDINQEIQQESF